MLDELDKKIEELETAWERYHRDSKNNPCPNMIELVKLRVRKRELERKDARMS